MKHIIITGNPVDGLAFTGPYDDADEARIEAEAFGASDGGEWWISPLNPPSDADDEDAAIARLSEVKAPQRRDDDWGDDG